MALVWSEGYLRRGPVRFPDAAVRGWEWKGASPLPPLLASCPDESSFKRTRSCTRSAFSVLSSVRAKCADVRASVTCEGGGYGQVGGVF